MKTKNLILAIVLTVANVFSFTSCEKESETNDEGEAYIEVTVNGKTYKENILFSANFYPEQTDELILVDICNYLEISDGYIDFGIWCYKDLEKFKNAKMGKYPIGNATTESNFALSIRLAGYAFVSGQHTVESLKQTGTETDTGETIYRITGTFSCTLQHESNGKTMEILGKYWKKYPEMKIPFPTE